MVIDLQDEDDRGVKSESRHDNEHLPRSVSPAPMRAGGAVAPAGVQGARGYSPAQRQLHWIVAALVAIQLALGLVIGTVDWQPRDDSPLRNVLIVHLVTGTVIFGLMCKRLFTASPARGAAAAGGYALGRCRSGAKQPSGVLRAFIGATASWMARLPVRRTRRRYVGSHSWRPRSGPGVVHLSPFGWCDFPPVHSARRAVATDVV
jgi:hypothetical protein